ncbi:PREDICTED: RING finger and transmembrane domain-containing protein 1-like isoform X2 [Polistes canadensis]|uniref:RING finger and transmembrane domain-containing protein 1-like isoform X2 n=1 Tax=Polistes canadensis TaxID=91411 RepID=UPI000718C289|nr:PREDICTED: RING finger and transmembrane domain-containing protein 1-like isoform X2 [Polistes canadensis]
MMTEKERLAILQNRLIRFKTNTTETNQVENLTNSAPECTTNTPTFDSDTRLPQHSRILTNLSSSVQRSYTAFSSLVNLPRLQNQTRAILSSTTGCLFVLNVIFDINVSTTQPLSLSELVWSVIATDFIIKLITVAFKVILTCLPIRLLACHKRGKYYVMIEVTSQLCRRFAPIQPWIYYLNEAYQGPEKVVGLVLTAIYTINKINNLIEFSKFFLKTLWRFIEDERLGSNPSAEQLINSGGICAICREEYKVPIILKCQHIFCEICVLTWLSTGRLCPMCRAPITDDAIYHNGHTTLFVQLY